MCNVHVRLRLSCDGKGTGIWYMECFADCLPTSREEISNTKLGRKGTD